MAAASASGIRPMRAPWSCATARRTRNAGSDASSRRTLEWAWSAMRTRATRTPSASRTSTASGCPPASDAMVAGAHPSVAVDGIVLKDGKLVAVRRMNEPYRGMPALPGGFVELGETTVEAVGREVREETGLETRVKRLVGVFSDPKRDPRGHVISIVYELEATGGGLEKRSGAAAAVQREAVPAPVVAVA